MNISPQNDGYNSYFTYTKGNPMQFARQTAKLNAYSSSLLAVDITQHGYFSGPLHFGLSYKPVLNGKFFDIDMFSAYPTWLLKYAKGELNYYVGGSKEYYSGYDFFRLDLENRGGVETYRINFAVKTDGSHKSRVYRNWLAKTMQVRNLFITEEYIGATINIPNINGMVQRFLDDVQGYDDYDIQILGIIKSSGQNAVIIRADEIAKSLRRKNSIHEDAEYEKLKLNSSTGFLAISDRVLYYTMINHIKGEVLKLIDKIEEFNRGSPDKLQIVAGNTDGITVYADEDMEDIIKSFVEYAVNPYTPFHFRVKDIYSEEDAHITPNDVKMIKVS